MLSSSSVPMAPPGLTPPLRLPLSLLVRSRLHLNKSPPPLLLRHARSASLLALSCSCAFPKPSTPAPRSLVRFLPPPSRPISPLQAMLSLARAPPPTDRSSRFPPRADSSASPNSLCSSPKSSSMAIPSPSPPMSTTAPEKVPPVALLVELLVALASAPASARLRGMPAKAQLSACFPAWFFLEFNAATKYKFPPKPNWTLIWLSPSLCRSLRKTARPVHGRNNQFCLGRR